MVGLERWSRRRDGHLDRSRRALAGHHPRQCRRPHRRRSHAHPRTRRRRHVRRRHAGHAADAARRRLQPVPAHGCRQCRRRAGHPDEQHRRSDRGGARDAVRGPRDRGRVGPGDGAVRQPRRGGVARAQRRRHRHPRDCDLEGPPLPLARRCRRRIRCRPRRCRAQWSARRGRELQRTRDGVAPERDLGRLPHPRGERCRGPGLRTRARRQQHLRHAGPDARDGRADSEPRRVRRRRTGHRARGRRRDGRVDRHECRRGRRHRSVDRSHLPVDRRHDDRRDAAEVRHPDRAARRRRGLSRHDDRDAAVRRRCELPDRRRHRRGGAGLRVAPRIRQRIGGRCPRDRPPRSRRRAARRRVDGDVGRRAARAVARRERRFGATAAELDRSRLPVARRSRRRVRPPARRTRCRRSARRRRRLRARRHGDAAGRCVRRLVRARRDRCGRRGRRVRRRDEQRPGIGRFDRPRAVRGSRRLERDGPRAHHRRPGVGHGRLDRHERGHGRRPDRHVDRSRDRVAQHRRRRQRRRRAGQFRTHGGARARRQLRPQRDAADDAAVRGALPPLRADGCAARRLPERRPRERRRRGAELLRRDAHPVRRSRDRVGIGRAGRAVRRHGARVVAHREPRHRGHQHGQLGRQRRAHLGPGRSLRRCGCVLRPSRRTRARGRLRPRRRHRHSRRLHRDPVRVRPHGRSVRVRPHRRQQQAGGRQRRRVARAERGPRRHRHRGAGCCRRRRDDHGHLDRPEPGRRRGTGRLVRHGADAPARRSGRASAGARIVQPRSAAGRGPELHPHRVDPDARAPRRVVADPGGDQREPRRLRARRCRRQQPARRRHGAHAVAASAVRSAGRERHRAGGRRRGRDDHGELRHREPRQRRDDHAALEGLRLAVDRSDPRWRRHPARHRRQRRGPRSGGTLPLRVDAVPGADPLRRYRLDHRAGQRRRCRRRVRTRRQQRARPRHRGDGVSAGRPRHRHRRRAVAGGLRHRDRGALHRHEQRQQHHRPRHLDRRHLARARPDAAQCGRQLRDLPRQRAAHRPARGGRVVHADGEGPDPEADRVRHVLHHAVGRHVRHADRVHLRQQPESRRPERDEQQQLQGARDRHHRHAGDAPAGPPGRRGRGRCDGLRRRTVHGALDRHERRRGRRARGRLVRRRVRARPADARCARRQDLVSRPLPEAEEPRVRRDLHAREAVRSLARAARRVRHGRDERRSAALHHRRRSARQLRHHDDRDPRPRGRPAGHERRRCTARRLGREDRRQLDRPQCRRRCVVGHALVGGCRLHLAGPRPPDRSRDAARQLRARQRRRARAQRELHRVARSDAAPRHRGAVLPARRDGLGSRPAVPGRRGHQRREHLLVRALPQPRLRDARARQQPGRRQPPGRVPRAQPRRVVARRATGGRTVRHHDRSAVHRDEHRHARHPRRLLDRSRLPVARCLARHPRSAGRAVRAQHVRAARHRRVVHAHGQRRDSGRHRGRVVPDRLRRLQCGGRGQRTAVADRGRHRRALVRLRAGVPRRGRQHHRALAAGRAARRRGSPGGERHDSGTRSRRRHDRHRMARREPRGRPDPGIADVLGGSRLSLGRRALRPECGPLSRARHAQRRPRGRRGLRHRRTVPPAGGALRAVLRLRRHRSGPARRLHSPRPRVRARFGRQQRDAVAAAAPDRAAAAGRPRRRRHHDAADGRGERADLAHLDRAQRRRLRGAGQLDRRRLPLEGRHVGPRRHAARSREPHRRTRRGGLVHVAAARRDAAAAARRPVPRDRAARHLRRGVRGLGRSQQREGVRRSDRRRGAAAASRHHARHDARSRRVAPLPRDGRGRRDAAGATRFRGRRRVHRTLCAARRSADRLGVRCRLPGSAPGGPGRDRPDDEGGRLLRAGPGAVRSAREHAGAHHGRSDALPDHRREAGPGRRRTLGHDDGERRALLGRCAAEARAARLRGDRAGALRRHRRDEDHRDLRSPRHGPRALRRRGHQSGRRRRRPAVPLSDRARAAGRRRRRPRRSADRAGRQHGPVRPVVPEPHERRHAVRVLRVRHSGDGRAPEGLRAAVPDDEFQHRRRAGRRPDRRALGDARLRDEHDRLDDGAGLRARRQRRRLRRRELLRHDVPGPARADRARPRRHPPGDHGSASVVDRREARPDDRGAAGGGARSRCRDPRGMRAAVRAVPVQRLRDRDADDPRRIPRAADPRRRGAAREGARRSDGQRRARESRRRRRRVGCQLSRRPRGRRPAAAGEPRAADPDVVEGRQHRRDARERRPDRTRRARDQERRRSREVLRPGAPLVRRRAGHARTGRRLRPSRVDPLRRVRRADPGAAGLRRLRPRPVAPDVLRGVQRVLAVGQQCLRQRVRLGAREQRTDGPRAAGAVRPGRRESHDGLGHGAAGLRRRPVPAGRRGAAVHDQFRESRRQHDQSVRNPDRHAARHEPEPAVVPARQPAARRSLDLDSAGPRELPGRLRLPQFAGLRAARQRRHRCGDGHGDVAAAGHRPRDGRGAPRCVARAARRRCRRLRELHRHECVRRADRR